MTSTTISATREFWGRAFGAGFHDAAVRRALEPQQYAKLQGGPSAENRWTYSQLSNAGADASTVRELRRRCDWGRASVAIIGGVGGLALASAAFAATLPKVGLALALVGGAAAFVGFAKVTVPMGAWISEFAGRGNPVQATYAPHTCRPCDCEKRNTAAGPLS
jgi:hypothetical protein